MHFSYLIGCGCFWIKMIVVGVYFFTAFQYDKCVFIRSGSVEREADSYTHIHVWRLTGIWLKGEAIEIPKVTRVNEIK